MKRRLILSGLIVFILVLSVLPGFPSASASSTWLDGFNYRKKLTVVQTSGAGTNYQINLNLRWEVGTDSGSTVYLNGHSQLDFDDVRFTKADSETHEDYYLGSILNGQSASAWIEISADLDSDNATIYLYYGNNTVSSTASVTNTFIQEITGCLIGSHFEQTTGTTVINGGSGSDGSLQQTIDRTASGYHKRGIENLNSPYGYIDYGYDGGTYDVTTEFTILAWVYHSSAYGTVGRKNDASNGFWLEITNDGWTQGFIWITGVGQFGVGDYSGINNLWVMLGLTYESGDALRIWKNGTNTASSTTITGSIQLGSSLPFYSMPYWIGTEDDLYFFNQALGSTEFTNLYNNYGDAYIKSGSCCVRKWLDTPPSVEVASEEAKTVLASLSAFNFIIGIVALTVGIIAFLGYSKRGN